MTHIIRIHAYISTYTYMYQKNFLFPTFSHWTHGRPSAVFLEIGPDLLHPRFASQVGKVKISGELKQGGFREQQSGKWLALDPHPPAGMKNYRLPPVPPAKGQDAQRLRKRMTRGREEEQTQPRTILQASDEFELHEDQKPLAKV